MPNKKSPPKNMTMITTEQSTTSITKASTSKDPTEELTALTTQPPGTRPRFSASKHALHIITATRVKAHSQARSLA